MIIFQNLRYTILVITKFISNLQYQQRIEQSSILNSTKAASEYDTIESTSEQKVHNFKMRKVNFNVK